MYDFDLVNVGRQVLGNHFALLRDAFRQRTNGVMYRLCVPGKRR